LRFTKLFWYVTISPISSSKNLKRCRVLALRKEGRWRYYSIRIPLDRFRAQAIEEVKTLPIIIPNLKKA